MFYKKIKKNISITNKKKCNYHFCTLTRIVITYILLSSNGNLNDRVFLK